MAVFALNFDVALAIFVADDEGSAIDTVPRERLPVLSIRHSCIILLDLCRSGHVAFFKHSGGGDMTKTGIFLVFMKSGVFVTAPHFSHSIHPSVSSRRRLRLRVPHMGHCLS